MVEVLDEEFWVGFLQQYYENEILEVIENYSEENHSLYINYGDLILKNPEMADRLIEEPSCVLDGVKKALIEYVKNIKETTGLADEEIERLNVRFIGLTRRLGIRNLRSEDISKFISIEGTIKKATEVRPKIVEAVFRCKICGWTSEPIRQSGKKFVEVYYCRDCGKKTPFVLLHERSKFVDAQKIRIEEYPEGLRGGEQPQTIDIAVEDDLAGKVIPGERVIVNGILRSYQKEMYGTKSPFFDIFLDCNSIEIQEREFEDIEISKEEEEEILELSNDPKIYEKMIRSVAPTIYGYEEIKEALFLQLFSGVSKHLPDGSRIRGDVHVLLVGDPGVAKSQLLRYIINLAPRGVYTSGKSSTSAGLTATAVKDDFGDGRWTLEAGALVLADKGIAAVDEMDKMRSDERSSLHEAMEQQTISVAKAGITATLRARCALLGAANPKMGRFDSYEPIASQINMPPTLLSRFDLIFIMADKPNVEKDAAMAEHILKAHYAGELKENRENVPGSTIGEEELKESMKIIEPEIRPDMLRKYIAYSKRNLFPVMSNGAFEKMKNFYTTLRGGEDDEDRPVPITARQLDALVRLAEASAKVRLSNEITEEDVERVIRIVEGSLRQVGIDRETGRLDVDVVMLGIPKSQHDRIRRLKDIIRELANVPENDRLAPEYDVLNMAEEEGMDRDRVERDISMLRREGEIMEIRPGYLKLV
jgi:replicative DNA helicase Mcm